MKWKIVAIFIIAGVTILSGCISTPPLKQTNPTAIPTPSQAPAITATPVPAEESYDFTKVTDLTYVMGAKYIYIANPKDPDNPVSKHDEKAGIIYVYEVPNQYQRTTANFRIFIDLENNADTLERLAFKHKGITIDSFKIVDQGSGKALQANVKYDADTLSSSFATVSGNGLREMPKKYQEIDESIIEATITESTVEMKSTGQNKLTSGINNINSEGLGSSKILLLQVALKAR